MKVAIFGAGEGGKNTYYYAAHQLGHQVICFADNDPQKAGQSFLGLNIVRPEALKRMDIQRVFVGSIYADEMAKQLAGLGFPSHQVEVVPHNILLDGFSSVSVPFLHRAGEPFPSLSAFERFFPHARAWPDKNAFILGFCRQKSVLDIGCIDHSHTTALGLGQAWLHRQIQAVAGDLTGLDILEADAAILNQKGFRIEVGDAQDFDLGKTFDVLVVGDLIEHLENIGLFLERCAAHMHPDSLAVITTPNPFYIGQTMRALLMNRIAVNRQHTVWLDPRVMWQLVDRSPLQIVDFSWVKTRFHLHMPGWRGLIATPPTKIISRWRPIMRSDYAVVLKLK